MVLDWSFTGEGAAGEDLANLVVDGFAAGLMDAPLLPELAHDGGLRGGGWSGFADQVRATGGATGAAVYSWFGPAIVGRVIRDDLGQMPTAGAPRPPPRSAG